MRALVLRALSTLLILSALSAQSAARAAPDANCGLDVPPPAAGVDRHMGVLLKIHPRNPDIGPDYAGCQTLWMQGSDGWQTVRVVHYAAGHVVRVESPARPGDPIERCRLDGERVLEGDAELCARLDDMRFESLPARCLDAPGAACELR
jgi:hypothetical protein